MLEQYVSIDLEMTGLNPKEDRMIEIGGVKVEEGEITETFSTLVNPHMRLSAEIEELTGITTEELKQGIEDWEAVGRLKEFVGDLPLTGHHIISDISFLRTCAVNHKETFENPVVDTLAIARKMLPKDMPKNLTSLCAYANVEMGESHRALEDAIATHRLLEWMKVQPVSKKEWFLPRNMVYKVKKQGPITPAQLRQLTELMEYHNLTSDTEIGSLTKNQASRKIDKIIFNYGRIPKA